MRIPYDLELLPIIGEELDTFIDDIYVVNDEETGKLFFEIKLLESLKGQEKELQRKVFDCLVKREWLFRDKTLTFELNLEELESNLLVRQEQEDENSVYGIQYIFKFENNWGASVIKSRWSHGSSENLWELALLQFTSDEEEPHLLPKGPDIFEDQEPIGYLSDNEVLEHLRSIRQFSSWSQE